MSKVCDFTRKIITRQSQSAHVGEQRRTYRREFNAFRRTFDQFCIGHFLKPAQADAERGLAQPQGFCGSAQVPVLGDRREVFDVA
jgi:hypothetical protein